MPMSFKLLTPEARRQDMKPGDFVSYFKGKHFAGHHWAYVEKVNRKTATVCVFYHVFKDQSFLSFSQDRVPLEWLRAEKPDSRISTKWGVMSINEIYQKTCEDHKASVDALREQAEPGHVVAPEEFVADPRARLERGTT